MRRQVCFAVLVALLFVLQPLVSVATPRIATAEPGPRSGSAAPEGVLAPSPLFIENVGQFAPGARFQMWGGNGTTWLAEDAIWIVVQQSAGDRRTGSVVRDRLAAGKLPAVERSAISDQPSARALPPVGRVALKVSFVGANAHPRLEAFGRLETAVSYFTGAPEAWHVGVPVWSAVRYVDLYPGVDLEIGGRETGTGLPWRFVTGHASESLPAALSSIPALCIEGVEGVAVAGDMLRLTTAVGDVALPLPAVAGPALSTASVLAPRNAKGQTQVRATGARTFEVRAPFGAPVAEAASPADEELAAPRLAAAALLSYCGYIGGIGVDQALSIAVDSAGDAYVTGSTYSDQTTFPVAVGPDPSFNGNIDAFVAKVNSAGTGLVYCGYIGGSAQGQSIAVDNAGNAYVTGFTYSDQTFPVTVGPDLSFNGGNYDAFVAKVNAAGTALAYCGYIGGASDEMGLGIAVDGAGNAYVAGQTGSNESTFPVTVGPDLSYNGGEQDVFVAKVNAAGTGLSYCGYIGGADVDGGGVIAVDGAGSAYVVGTTYSDETTFPVAVGPDLSFNGGIRDAFVAKVNAAGTGLSYCGYIGGSSEEYGYGVAVDGAGNAYVAGETQSDQSTFPVSVGPDLGYNGGSWDAFVAKVNAAGTALAYCGYIGGAGNDEGYGIAVDGAGDAYVTGWTDSDQSTFPVAVGPDLSFNGGDLDGFVAKVNAEGTGLVYCGYIGGTGIDFVSGIAVDGAGNAYVTGNTYSDQTTFPVTVGPDLSFNGYLDAFVAKITIENVPPIVTPQPDQAVDEGASTSFVLGSFSDPDVNDAPWAVDVDWGDGSPHSVFNMATQGALTPQSHTYADGPNTYLVAVKVTDRDGGVDSKMFRVAVNNVEPTPAILGAPNTSLEGILITLTGTATDPSPVDTAAGFTYSWTATKEGAPYASGSGGSFTFRPIDPGTYVVNLSATDKEGGVGSSSATIDVTMPATVRLLLLDSGGRGLAGGTAQYYDGTWRSIAGNTDADGILVTDIPATRKNLTFRMTYAYGSNDKAQNVSSNPLVVFQTTRVAVELHDSADALLDTGTVQYYAGAWRTFGSGSTSGGRVSMELLPNTYTFRMTYAYGSNDKAQNVGSNPTVVFQTTRVAVELHDSAGALLDTGTVQYYAGAWRTFGSGSTSGGSVRMELLPNTYTFRMTYAYGSSDKAQNVGSNPMVVFQTTRVAVELHDSTGALLDTGTVQYYAGAWRTFGSGSTSGGSVSMELLPNTYTFRMTYAYGSNDKAQNVGSNPTVVFQTMRVAVELHDSAGALLDTGTVQYYAGAWRTFGSGSTSGGSVSMELLPNTYTFRMTYAYGSNDKAQNVGSNPVVAFQTGQVHSDTGACTRYYAGAWRNFVQDMQLLPGSYPSRFSDGTPDGNAVVVSGTVNHIH